MSGKVLEMFKQQRLAQSSAVIVGLILIMVAHAPVWPVIAGCALAMGILVLRGLHRSTKHLPIRGPR